MTRLAITGNTTPNWSMEEDIRDYLAAGVQGIGVWWHKLHACGIERAIDLLQDADMSVSSLNYAGVFALEDRSVQPALIPGLEQAVELAARLGAATLSVMPGPKGEYTRREAIQKVKEGLAYMASLAEKYDVKLALEPHHPMYTDTVAVVNMLPQALEIVEEVGSDHVGILLDVYHVWWHVDVLGHIAAAGKKIFNVHVNDWRDPTRDLMCDRAIMGEGVMPLRELISAIEATGYDGWYEVEVRSREPWALDHHGLVRRCVTAWDDLCVCNHKQEHK